jgi:hypothetical protein
MKTPLAAVSPDRLATAEIAKWCKVVKFTGLNAE